MCYDKKPQEAAEQLRLISGTHRRPADGGGIGK